MPADRPSATQPASLGSAAADAAPSPELLERLTPRRRSLVRPQTTAIYPPGRTA